MRAPCVFIVCSFKSVRGDLFFKNTSFLVAKVKLVPNILRHLILHKVP